MKESQLISQQIKKIEKELSVLEEKKHEALCEEMPDSTKKFFSDNLDKHVMFRFSDQYSERDENKIEEKIVIGRIVHRKGGITKKEYLNDLIKSNSVAIVGLEFIIDWYAQHHEDTWYEPVIRHIIPSESYYLLNFIDFEGVSEKNISVRNENNIEDYKSKEMGLQFTFDTGFKEQHEYGFSRGNGFMYQLDSALNDYHNIWTRSQELKKEFKLTNDPEQY